MTEDLEILWCRQLIVEFSRIVKERRIPLECPNVQINSGGKKLGHWSPTGRTIAISGEFIKAHTWDVVVEILKHEIAHQYVTDVLKDTESTSHGPAFQNACLAVGVHPDYRGASGRHPKFMRVKGDDQEKQAPHLKKIAKLLALAESSNEHEAALAMEKANAIIAKYNIDFVFNGLEAEYDYIRISTGGKKTPLWMKWIVGILQKHFFVKTIIVSSYDVVKCCEVKAFDLVGNKNNLAVAEYVFNFLSNSLERLWEDHRKKTGAGLSAKRSFCVGVLKGFGEKLDIADAADQARHEQKMQRKTGATTSLLIVDQDPVLSAFYAERYPRVRNVRTKAKNIQREAFNSGVGEGKRLTIHKPLSSSNGNKGRFLTT